LGSHIDISKGKVTLSESAIVAQENLTMRLLGALNSLDTLLNFAATQQEHLSADSMAEVLRLAYLGVKQPLVYFRSLILILLLVVRISRIFITLL
jgi:hypothetical protein